MSCDFYLRIVLTQKRDNNTVIIQRTLEQ